MGAGREGGSEGEGVRESKMPRGREVQGGSEGRRDWRELREDEGGRSEGTRKRQRGRGWREIRQEGRREEGRRGGGRGER